MPSRKANTAIFMVAATLVNIVLLFVFILLGLIVLTHGHLDHVQNAAFLSQQLEVPIAMHRADLELLEDNDRQPMQAHRRLGRLIQSLSRRGFQDTLLPPFQPDLYLEDGDDLSHFGVSAQVVALPGHTAGSIGLKTEDGALLVGDAMFRLFSPAPALVYADRRQMEDSVAKIWALHPTALYFGHGRPAQGL